MEIKPNVTVVITCFNLSHYIVECIESVLKQSYQGKVTILVGDDASIDNSVALIKQLQCNHKNIILVEHAQNIGTAANVISLYQKVEDEYIVHLDGDDIMLVDRLDITVSYLEKNPDVDLVCCELSRFKDVSNEALGKHYQDHYQKNKFEQGFTLHTLIEHGSFILPSSLTFRKKLLQRLTLISEILVIDDYVRHLQLMLSAKRGRILFIPLTRYRVRDDGSTGLMKTGKQRRLQSLNDMIYARELILKEEVASVKNVNKGIAGEYFAASLYFLRLNHFVDFKLCMENSLHETGCFYSLKHKLIFYSRFSPNLCKLLLRWL